MTVTRRAVLHGAAFSALAPSLGWAFDREGNRKILVFSGNQAVPVLDPHVRYDWSTRMIQQSVYDGLMKYVGNPPRIIPWLAERWDETPDGLTYTFHLVGNAKFHNGDALDAEAVRYSFERGLKLNAGIAWMLKDFLKPENIVAVDPRTVRFDRSDDGMEHARISCTVWAYGKDKEKPIMSRGDTSKADLKPESTPSLNEIGKLLKSQPNLKVYIVGHTDNVGGFDYNMGLSQRRAKSVVDRLVQSYGIAANRLHPVGAGLIAPVASNDDEAGRAKNRRVEIVKE